MIVVECTEFWSILCCYDHEVIELLTWKHVLKSFKRHILFQNQFETWNHYKIKIMPPNIMLLQIQGPSSRCMMMHAKIPLLQNHGPLPKSTKSSTNKSVCKEPNGYDSVEEILGGIYTVYVYLYMCGWYRWYIVSRQIENKKASHQTPAYRPSYSNRTQHNQPGIQHLIIKGQLLAFHQTFNLHSCHMCHWHVLNWNDLRIGPPLRWIFMKLGPRKPANHSRTVCHGTHAEYLIP